ncbi:MAG: hypothetical protein ACI9LS_001787, partial [Flavobacteriales bacterium]
VFVLVEEARGYYIRSRLVFVLVERENLSKKPNTSIFRL